MQRLVAILITVVWSLGMTHPGGIDHPIDLHGLYEQCGVEDPDITPLDFVFEHLLNLEHIISFFEGEEHDGVKDLPHQPYQVAHTVSVSSVIIPDRCAVAVVRPHYDVVDVVYPSSRPTSYFFNYHADIFRPPIV